MCFRLTKRVKSFIFVIICASVPIINWRNRYVSINVFLPKAVTSNYSLLSWALDLNKWTERWVPSPEGLAFSLVTNKIQFIFNSEHVNERVYRDLTLLTYILVKHCYTVVSKLIVSMKSNGEFASRKTVIYNSYLYMLLQRARLHCVHSVYFHMIDSFSRVHYSIARTSL